ncbi:sulfate ABC transporter permease subunit CysT [Laspinema olomoucense]|uniref:sulfate ABC transporter permease subunit CysT n=1 Tax=Laspinema olomoucense TaxID=3231600 RepID=UPI0021BBB0B1|nr:MULTISPECIES: sulfate ABC transporter permease subunit CysT [unclassified Laspinema]MCT7986794.1 sulfate ABC transporter permease subunit CysT [Laspinema sp. D3a]MCT7997121.1 sulfate ABC transporter permease subunit CysT [Laspinema sp. D3c]
MAISFNNPPKKLLTSLGGLLHLSWPWRITIGYLSIMLLLPMTALLWKSASKDPSEFWRIATSPVAISAYDVTFVTAFVTALINGVFGTLIAWVLVRYDFPFKRIIDAAIDLPFALPTAVAGLTIATVYSRTGWIGSLLEPFGIQIAFTRFGVGIAMLFISLPFVVRTVQPVLREIEPEVEEVAWSLGASNSQTFWRIIIPQLISPILIGVALGFSRAVGEYGSIVIVASNIPFKDLIAPVLIFQRLEQYDYYGATVIGVVLLAVSLAILFAINLVQAWGRRYA